MYLYIGHTARQPNHEAIIIIYQINPTSEEIEIDIAILGKNRKLIYNLNA